MRKRTVAIVVAALTACLLASASASADIKIRQVRPDSQGSFSTGDWVELQLTADGQSTAGRHLITYDPGGTVFTDYLIPSNPPVAQSQRTFLITNGSSVGTSSVTPDLNAGLLGPPPGGLDMTGQDGAVCLTDPAPSLTPVDCVSYGAFTGSISSAGTPATATPFGSTIERKISPNCATALDDADDANTGSDFAPSTAEPRNNSATPTETPCASPNNPAPNTKIDKAPKNKVKTKKRKATVSYQFSADVPNSSFQCSLDGKPFQACTSPFETKAKKGKHEFDVQATSPGGLTDQSPAEDSFKVKRKK